MLVSHRHRFIYQKVHKTASTSVEILLEPFCCTPESYPGPEHHRAELVTADGIIGRRGPKKRRVVETWYNHMPAAEVHALLGEESWSRYHKFCVVRNPYEKAVSWFWFAMRPPLTEELATAPFAAVRAAFREWLRDPAVIARDGHVYLIDGRFALDAWLRYEHLSADLAALWERLCLPPAPVPLGTYKSEHRRRGEPWQAYYDAGARAVVEAIYDHEFAVFGYDRAR